MKNYIILEGMKFYAHHGVLDQEKTLGNCFIVDLKLKFDLSRAAQSDQLEDTINYSTVYTIVKEEISIPSQLLEHVAGRIKNRILEVFPEIKKVRIRLSKPNPPVGGEVAKATVIL